jgi:hypothetical protein
MMDKLVGQESQIHQSGPRPAPARNQQNYVTDSGHDIDFIQQNNEITIKWAELKRSLSKYLSPTGVHNALSYVSMNCMTLSIG